MKLRSLMGLSLVAVLACSVLSFAADDKPPVTPVKPDAAKPAADTKGVRLIKPYSDLKDLTAEQTTKLKEIHKKYGDQVKAIEAQQKEEMMAVLTDVQRKEIADLPKKATTKKPDPSAPATPAAPVAPSSPDPKDPAKDGK